MSYQQKSSSKIEKGIQYRLRDFAGYTTLHGINRLAANKQILGKIVWCCIILVCVGFCSRQIYNLCRQFASNNVNTRISMRYQTVYFPFVSFCNLNPVSLSRMESLDSQNDSNVHHYSYIMRKYFAESANGLYNQLSEQGNNTSSKEIPAFNIAFEYASKAEHKFRQAMNYFDFKPWNFTMEGIRYLNPPIEDFVLVCIFEGRPCNLSSFVPFFDYYYGLCYRFPPTPKISKRSGSMFALQMVLNINQSDYIPYVIQDAGIRLSIHKPETEPFLQNSGWSLSTGLQTDVSLVQKSIERLPDRTECDSSNVYNSRLECFEKCRLEMVLRICNCSIYLLPDHNISFDPWTCFNDKDLDCMEHVQQNLSNCGCISPCSQTNYEKTVTSSKWPAKKYEAALEMMFEKRGLNYSDYKDSLLAVNIFLSSLSDELTVEEPAITVENLLSNIGGSLGLWIGMSIISVGEVIELMWLLCHAVSGRRKTEYYPDKDKE